MRDTDEVDTVILDRFGQGEGFRGTATAAEYNGYVAFCEA